MLKKTITYVDFNETERSEDFYFNLTKAELQELAYSEDGGLEQYLRIMVQTQDVKKIISVFKKLILKAYGVRSADGRFFSKSEEASNAFAGSEAYSELFIDITKDPDSAMNFILGILPEDVRKEVNKQMSEPAVADNSQNA